MADAENNLPALRETDIRPKDIMATQATLFARDIARLSARRDEFVRVPCPACGNHDHALWLEKYSQEFQRCLSCDTMYMSPRPTAAILGWYYATSENNRFWAEHIFPTSEAVRRERIFRPRAERLIEICKRYDVGRNLLVEVGAGFGIFSEILTSAGWFRRVVAVEPSPDFARRCRERGVEVIESPIEQVSFKDEAVDVVASFEVIEHLFDPREFLENCASVLRPGGLLILTCPNGRGFEVQTLGAVSDTVDVEHITYFNPKSLAALVERCGLDVLETTTPGVLDADIVRNKVLDGQFSLAGQPLLEEVLIRSWDRLGVPFQKFLSENGLSSHMWLVARKR